MDLQHQELIRFGNLHQGVYQQEMHHQSGLVSPVVFPDVEVVVQWLMMV
ncbi:MAG: hypothetical protein F6J87_11035 [Spirulina sp. SIO3F2]|nr:hypothetical protein [Spirulina sp. SIO3F2]